MLIGFAGFAGFAGFVGFVGFSGLSFPILVVLGLECGGERCPGRVWRLLWQKLEHFGIGMKGFELDERFLFFICILLVGRLVCRVGISTWCLIFRSCITEVANL